MKFQKKTAMIVSFTVGTLLLASTALADITSKSGYDQLKDAIKVTAEQSSEKFDSFTFDMSSIMKDNGKVVLSDNMTTKYDRRNAASESFSSGVRPNGEKSFAQTYSDKTTMIRVSDSDPTYYVTEFTKGRTDNSLKNPFKEERADDLEKIADAIVGSLKDHVVVTDNSDGSKGISGTLTEVQIPTLVNAVVSFQLKQEFNGNQNNMPRLTKDVFVKEVKGAAKVNKDGVMESILGTAVLSGKDDQGMLHDISIEALIKVTNINSTSVLKPDLTGKNVVRNIAKDYSDSEISNPEKFVGKFKNDVLIEKDGKFIKIGERFIDITSIKDKVITGRYFEVYKSGYENYATNMSNLKFEARFEENQKGNANFNGSTDSGVKVQGNIYLSDYEGKVNFGLNNMYSTNERGLIFDSSFSPDLD